MIFCFNVCCSSSCTFVRIVDKFINICDKIIYNLNMANNLLKAQAGISSCLQEMVTVFIYRFVCTIHLCQYLK